MPDEADAAPRGVDPVDPCTLEERLRAVVRRLLPQPLVDELEVRHLLRVVTECSLLLTDVYSDGRIQRIMYPSPRMLSTLVDRLIQRERHGEGEVLYRVRRLPDDVRVVGDKALFDRGLRGLRRVKGYDLEELGSRAYRRAAETLELLAEDRRLREFFAQNRLLMLPLEDEVTFLRQCSERFPVYADILRHVQAGDALGAGPDELNVRVPLMAAAAAALESELEVGDGSPESSDDAGGDEDGDEDAYREAARRDSGSPTFLSRGELIAAYERTVLFSSLEMERVRRALKSVVVDQDEAVEVLCDEFSLFAAGTRDLGRAPGYFLVGPTGVGKNHLVESLCRMLEGIWKLEVPVLIIEGPSYTYPSDINELRGATRGFIRSDEEGLLSTFHERSSVAPLGVILVDEVEKAHAQLRKFFLAILDRGTTTDNKGRVLNFSNCMIFFTSNLGYSDAQQRSAPIGYMDARARSESADRDVRRGLRRALSPEFMNRVRMIHFGRLTRESAERILDLELDRIARRYQEMHGLGLELAPSAREELIRRGFSPVFGARHLAEILERVCNVEVAKKVRRDDAGDPNERQSLVRWLREIRQGDRAFELEEVRRRVLEAARAQLEYSAIRVIFEEGRFAYVPIPDQGVPS